MQNQEYYYIDEFDKEYLSLMLEIEKRCQEVDKHTRLRIESWCRKFSTVAFNSDLKKNRNIHAMCLLDMIINNRFEDPYCKFAPEGEMPILSVPLVKSRLSMNFWRNAGHIFRATETKSSKGNSLVLSHNSHNQSKDEESKSSYPNYKASQVLQRNTSDEQLLKRNKSFELKRTVNDLINENKKKDKIIKIHQYDIYKLEKKQEKLNKLLIRQINKNKYS